MYNIGTEIDDYSFFVFFSFSSVRSVDSCFLSLYSWGAVRALQSGVPRRHLTQIARDRYHTTVTFLLYVAVCPRARDRPSAFPTSPIRDIPLLSLARIYLKTLPDIHANKYIYIYSLSLYLSQDMQSILTRSDRQLFNLPQWWKVTVHQQGYHLLFCRVMNTSSNGWIAI